MLFSFLSLLGRRAQVSRPLPTMLPPVSRGPAAGWHAGAEPPPLQCHRAGCSSTTGLPPREMLLCRSKQNSALTVHSQHVDNHHLLIPPTLSTEGTAREGMEALGLHPGAKATLQEKMQLSHLLTDVAEVILATKKMAPGVSWGLCSVHPEALKEGMLRSPEQHKTHTFLAQAGTASQTSRAMGPIQADHYRGVPALQADVLLLTTPPAEHFSRLALTAAAALIWQEMLYLPTQQEGQLPSIHRGGDLFVHTQAGDISELLTCLWDGPRKPCHGAFPVTCTAFSTSPAAQD